MPRPRAYDTIDCPCGGCFTKYNERRHTYTKKHLNYILSLDENTEEYINLFERASFFIWNDTLRGTQSYWYII